jgi:uncharacterized membrane protein
MMWDGDGAWAHGWGWGIGGWIMGIGMIALVVVAVVLIVYLVRQLSTPAASTAAGQGAGQQYAAGPGQHAAPAVPPPAAQVETPREIVQRRYAAGEIDREEYLQKLQDL